MSETLPKERPWWKPGSRRAHRGPSWDCRAVQKTSTKEHHCKGHVTGRPDYMHLCECGFRWAD